MIPLVNALFASFSMTATALVLVFVGVLGAIYSYLLYPIIMLALRDASRDNQPVSVARPKLSLIIAARNEERRIRQKLDESVALLENHPDLEILVASDASTDKTDEIAAEFSPHGVKLVRSSDRFGKEYAQRSAIAESSGEILIFTDTGTTIVAGSIARIVELFDDSAIGAVSSTDRLINRDGSVSGEGMYIRYEMWLRELESRKGGLIGLSGSFFAARRSVCDRWETDIPSDFVVAMNCRMAGLRAVSDSGVIGEYQDAKDSAHEFARKVRTVIRGMTAVMKRREALNPARYGFLAFQLWSHKILRWGVPWFAMCYCLGAALAASESAVYSGLLVPPLAVILVSALGAVAPGIRQNRLIAGAYFFMQVNSAALVAALQFALGKRVTTWAPTTR